MSWVFLAGERVYKLKKPVRYSFLDFRSIQARENDCREEVRLNRRLAEEIYLGVAPLIRRDDGRLSIDREGRTVDWLVVMQRLPRDRMLDSAILARAVSHAEIVSVADWLSPSTSALNRRNSRRPPMWPISWRSTRKTRRCGPPPRSPSTKGAWD